MDFGFGINTNWWSGQAKDKRMVNCTVILPPVSIKCFLMNGNDNGRETDLKISGAEDSNQKLSNCVSISI